ncbi:MAG: leucine-rich repeat domain-containing protein, partial [Prevotella sp.]|nr:leucine-rich repeat domain-containing protein [Prevotella sp.]
MEKSIFTYYSLKNNFIMKKQLLFFLFALLPMLAMADDSGKCGDNVTYYYSSSTQTLTIQGTGAIKNYVTFPWNSYKDDIITIVIEDGVTSIGNRAFYDCSGLTSVTIPNSVTSIGGGAFYGTAWYNNQPDGLIYAGKLAYTYKGTMPENTSITIKDGTLVIAESAFQDRSGLTSVTIPNSVTSIGKRAFYGCSGLTSVTIGTGVT